MREHAAEKSFRSTRYVIKSWTQNFPIIKKHTFDKSSVWVFPWKMSFFLVCFFVCLFVYRHHRKNLRFEEKFLQTGSTQGRWNLERNKISKFQSNYKKWKITLGLISLKTKNWGFFQSGKISKQWLLLSASLASIKKWSSCSSESLVSMRKFGTNWWAWCDFGKFGE